MVFLHATLSENNIHREFRKWKIRPAKWSSQMPISEWKIVAKSVILCWKLQHIIIRRGFVPLSNVCYIACGSFLRKSFDYRCLRLDIVHAFPTILQVRYVWLNRLLLNEPIVSILHHNRTYFTRAIIYWSISCRLDSMKNDLFLLEISFSA